MSIRKKLKVAGQRSVVGMVVVSMLATNPILAAETIGDNWQSNPQRNTVQENQLWKSNPGKLSSDKRGKDLGWGSNNPPENSGTRNQPWSGSQNKTNQGASDAQNLTNSIDTDSAYPSGRGSDGTVQFGENESVSKQDLFGGRGGDASARSAYGSKDQFRSRGQQAQAQLETDDSMAGEAYRLVESQSDRARPDFRNDPAWSSSDGILGNALSGDELQCDGNGGGIRYEQCRRNFDPKLPEGCGFDRVSETEDDVIERDVFSYKGCIDHIYVDIQVANADEQLFDDPGGYRVIPGRGNEVADQWNGRFHVRSNRGNGANDHMSGVYYDFDPLDGEKLSDLNIDNISMQFRNVSKRNAANFRYKVVRTPSPENNWVARIRLDDAGVSGGDPRCPAGKSDGSMGWVEFDLRIMLSGKRLVRDEWVPKSPACDIADREYGDMCEKDYSCARYETTVSESGPDCIVVDGKEFCNGLTPPPVDGISKGCIDIDQDWSCDLPGHDQPDTCSELDEDPQCGYVSSQCAPGAYDEGEQKENAIPRTERNVFSYAGCFDHNEIDVQVAGAPRKSFDTRNDPTSPGYRVIPKDDINQIDDLWPGQFNVRSTYGPKFDHLSGVYYAFDPYDIETVEDIGRQEFDVEIVNRSSRNNAPFSYDVIQKPSQANGWIATIAINDNGTQNGSPGCPFGSNGPENGWVEFDLRVGFGSDERQRDGRCYAWDDTYRCEVPQDDAACAAQDLMGNDFADCEVTLEEEEYTEEVSITQTETCQRPRQISSCEIEREITRIDRTSSSTASAGGCFYSKTSRLTPGWGKNYINVSAKADTSSQNVGVSVTNNPTPQNDWAVTVRFSGTKQTMTRQKTVINEDGEEVTVTEEYQGCPEQPHSASATITWKGQEVRSKLNYFPADGEEFNSPCLRFEDGISDVDAQCTQSTGFSMRPHLSGELKPMYKDELLRGTICKKADLQYKPLPKDSSVEGCITDNDGNENCTNYNAEALTGVNEANCAALEERVNKGECERIENRPVGSGSGDTGIQYYFETVYECKDPDYKDKEVTKTRTTEKYQCSGDVSCMGEDCVNVERDVSGQFEKAVGLLDMLNSMDSDMECSSDNPESCRVFPGEAKTCKVVGGGALGNDCCDTPDGVSLSDYIGAMRATKQLDSVLVQADAVPNVQGAWKTIRDPAVDAFSATKKHFSSAMDSITGVAQEKATDAAQQGIMDQFKQAAMRKTQEFLQSTFNKDVAKMFVKQGAENQLVLNSGFSTALSVIGTAYAIYVIADLLVSIIWACDQSELQLGADRELKKTKYIGPYCSQDTFFGCWEHTHVYCSFNAPLPRIIQEQVRPQLGMSWGTAKNPNCSGIPVKRLEEVDWSRVDLGEWTNMLDVTGHMPENKSLGLESITGDQSTLNTGDRDNSVERTIKRAEGANIGEQAFDSKQEMWGEK